MAVSTNLQPFQLAATEIHSGLQNLLGNHERYIATKLAIVLQVEQLSQISVSKYHLFETEDYQLQSKSQREFDDLLSMKFRGQDCSKHDSEASPISLSLRLSF